MTRIFRISSLFLLLGGLVILFLYNEKYPISFPMKNAQIIIKKSERKLLLYDDGRLARTYDIVLGFAPEGDKEKRDDGKTPEGEFYVAVKNPQSKFTLGLGLSYPNMEDAERGLKTGLISREQYDAIVAAINEKRMPPQDTPLGSEIYIHGGGTAKDWTWGCMALDDEEIRELYEAVPVGAKVLIEK
jgi:murein L,D-transpeptidase YafK